MEANQQINVSSPNSVQSPSSTVTITKVEEKLETIIENES
jgi:hypothetical protein